MMFKTKFQKNSKKTNRKTRTKIIDPYTYPDQNLKQDTKMNTIKTKSKIVIMILETKAKKKAKTRFRSRPEQDQAQVLDQE